MGLFTSWTKLWTGKAPAPAPPPTRLPAPVPVAKSAKSGLPGRGEGLFKSWLKREKGIDLDAGAKAPTRTWEPMYPDVARDPRHPSPDVARDPNASVATEDTRSDEESIGENWVYAPYTSHISKMQFEDASTVYARGRGKWRFLSGESRLWVGFKPDPKTGRGGAEYMYFFKDWALAKDVWEDLITSPHPYGEVLYPRVIKAGVPYKPNWRS